ncbi:MAG: DUF1192 domain-containing protein [Alphaproteobacteria bacterium]
MDEEELLPRKVKPRPRNLEDMSIEQLNAYIVELEAEIARVKADIAVKQAALSDARSVFHK